MRVDSGHRPAILPFSSICDLLGVALDVGSLVLEENGVVPADTGERTERVLRTILLFNVDEIAEWLEIGESDESRFHPRDAKG